MIEGGRWRRVGKEEGEKRKGRKRKCRLDRNDLSRNMKLKERERLELGGWRVVLD